MSTSNFNTAKGRCTCYPPHFFFLHGTYHIVIKLKTLHPLTPDPKFSEVMEKELNTLRIQNLQKSTKEAVAQLKYSSKIPTNLWALGKTN